MSKTYRSSSDGQPRSDGGRHYSKPRYRPGSRQKPHRIEISVSRREKPDLGRLAREITRVALEATTLDDQDELDEDRDPVVQKDGDV